MRGQHAAALAFIIAGFIAASPAGAVVMGTFSSLGSYTVRLVGSYSCSGVAIARNAVVTAGHCARGMRVLAGGRTIRVAHVARSVQLDDGRRARVSGDAAILVLSVPLPPGVSVTPIGDGGGMFTIAGYGTTDERSRSFGALHEATLVSAGAHALVDPNRSGLIGASACFGDSGGPVMRGGLLVGVITRADYPHRRIACGDLTRWAPVRVSGAAQTAAAPQAPEAEAPAIHRRHRRHARRARRAHAKRTAAAGWPPEVEARSSWHKAAWQQ
jgi:Trypsin